MVTQLKQWLSQFCMWHEQYRRNELGADMLASYGQARATLCATLVLAQRIEFHHGGARQALRVARALPVEFDLGVAKISALTQDISAGGLSALVGEEPLMGSRFPFRLNLGRKLDPVSGRCRVLAAIPAEGVVRMAVVFETITSEGRSRIEDMVVDTICAEIRTMRLHEDKRTELPAWPAEGMSAALVG